MHPNKNYGSSLCFVYVFQKSYCANSLFEKLSSFYCICPLFRGKVAGHVISHVLRTNKSEKLKLPVKSLASLSNNHLAQLKLVPNFQGRETRYSKANKFTKCVVKDDESIS